MLAVKVYGEAEFWLSGGKVRNSDFFNNIFH